MNINSEYEGKWRRYVNEYMKISVNNEEDKYGYENSNEWILRRRLMKTEKWRIMKNNSIYLWKTKAIVGSEMM